MKHQEGQIRSEATALDDDRVLLPNRLGVSAESASELFVDAVLHEYDSIREESMQSSQHQNRLLQWGATALAGFYTFSFGAWTSNLFLTLATLLFLIPTLSATLFTLWLSEVARMKRAGEYLCVLEHKLSLAIRQPQISIGSPESIEVTVDLCVDRELLAMPLSWEHWLRAPSSSRQLGHLGWKYLYTANVLRFAGFVSLLLGGVYLVAPGGVSMPTPVPSLVFALPAVAYATWLYRSMSQLLAVSSQASLAKPDWVENPPNTMGDVV